MMFYDYEFKSKEYQNIWLNILSNRFQTMELYYRKKFSMQGLLTHFKKSFGITPRTLKNSTEDKYYEKKLLALYLLTQYSKETFEVIANEFNISLETLNMIATNSIYKDTFDYEIKQFFKEFEDDFLMERKSSLAFSDSMTPYIKTI